MITLNFLQPNQVQQILSQEDEYLRNISPLSLQMVRCRTVNDYRTLLLSPNLALPLSQQEQRQITGIVNNINARLQELNLDFDLQVNFAKTSGMESMTLPYTRLDTIVLTFPFMQALSMGMPIPGVNGLQGLIAHEIFHVVSRNNPQIREDLYGLYNFRYQPLEEVIPQLVTNPDAPNADYVVDVTHQGQQKTVRPVLALTAMNPMAMQSMDKQLYFEGRLIPMNQTDYRTVIGATSPYSAYHPEEVCAENFRLLMEGQDFTHQDRFLEILRGI